jgi:hypothetical protein
MPVLWNFRLRSRWKEMFAEQTRDLNFARIHENAWQALPPIK